MQSFVNANVSFSFTVEKQASDSVSLPSACAHVRAGGGCGPPCGTREAYQCFGITVYSIWSNFSWLKH